MKKRNIDLSEHQSILYDIMYTFDDYCKKHNIKYYMAGGTLLGAVRHQGIIPWDDDIDVMMPRPEYNKLLELLHKDCPVGYVIYDIDNSKDYYYPIAKFGKKNTIIKEDDWHCVPSEGIAINMDIFPLDGCPENFKEAQNFTVNQFNNNIKMLNFWFETDLECVSDVKTKILLLLKHFPCLLKTKIKKQFKKGMKYDFDTSTYISSNCFGWYGEKEVFKRSLYNETVYLKFGDRKLPAHEGYIEYLTALYGDFMTPPPVEKRGSTHDIGTLYVIE